VDLLMIFWAPKALRSLLRPFHDVMKFCFFGGVLEYRSSLEPIEPAGAQMMARCRYFVQRVSSFLSTHMMR